jgi:outer membrane protein TolC
MAADTLRMQAMRAAMVAQLVAVTGDSLPPDVIAAFPNLPDTVPALADMQSLATRARPMVQAGEAEVRAAESNAKLAQREILPDLQVGIQLGRGAATMVERNADGMIMLDRKSETMGSLMIGASIPIFARDRQYRMRTEAEAMRAMAAADLAAMQADTRARVAEVYAALVRSRSLSALYRTSILPQASATVASSQSAYRTGSVDFMTLLDNQMTVNRYREELATLEAEEGKAWAELEMLIARVLLDARSVRARAGGAR